MAIAACAVLAGGCGGDQFSDLKQFVEDSGKDLRGRVEPIPEVKQFEPFAYNAFELPDPSSRAKWHWRIAPVRRVAVRNPI
jgi:type IV pilus assembly protein PilP